MGNTSEGMQQQKYFEAPLSSHPGSGVFCFKDTLTLHQ